MKHEFPDDLIMTFDSTNTKLLGTALDAAHIYDTETCALLAVRSWRITYPF
jgi:hypothetical protein